jgi:hypothetical protein
MESNIYKSSQYSGHVICAERLTSDLVQSLKKLLASRVYLTYKTSYRNSDFKHELNIEGQLEFIFGKPPGQDDIRNIRNASNVWNELELINRLIVLDAFATLYHDVLTNYNPVEKTILFCQIFINDFVSIITSF